MEKRRQLLILGLLGQRLGPHCHVPGSWFWHFFVRTLKPTTMQINKMAEKRRILILGNQVKVNVFSLYQESALNYDHLNRFAILILRSIGKRTRSQGIVTANSFPLTVV